MDTKKVIKEFLEKMAKQDNRCTAAPYFYVIRTEKEVQADLNNCSEIRYYDPECYEHTYDSTEEARKTLKEEGYEPNEVDQIVDRLEQYGINRVWENRGMFLTEEDAKKHLELNHYHYSHNAHTYVDHAWRAPELTAFFEALFNEFGVDRGNWRA